jgi:hypothetical protein
MYCTVDCLVARGRVKFLQDKVPGLYVSPIYQCLLSFEEHGDQIGAFWGTSISVGNAIECCESVFPLFKTRGSY